MGNTTIIELDHDRAGEIEDNPGMFAQAVLTHLRLGNGSNLPGGRVVACWNRGAGGAIEDAYESFKRLLRWQKASLEDWRPDDAAASSKKRRCVAEMGGHRCEKPMGHFGDHYALWLEGQSERSANWTEVDGMVNYREQWRPVRG